MFLSLFALVPLGFLLLLFFSSITHKSHSHNNGFTNFYPSYGPPSYPFIGCLISFYKNRPRLLTWYTDLLTNSPTQTIVVHRLGARRTIVTANPANVEYMLKTNFNNFPKGKPLTEILGDLLGRGIFNIDGERWSAQRKLASHEFSAKLLREFVVKTLEEEVENRLVPLLETASESEDVLDMQEVLRRFTFDTICKVSLGTDPCCLDLSRPVPPLIQALDSASEISAMRGVAPVFLIWKMKRALNIGSERKLKESVKLVHDLVSDIVNFKKTKLEGDREKESKEAAEDLLSRLLLAGHEDEVIRDMAISFIIAGRDTTSSAMTWLFWLLSQYPDTEKEILKEVECETETPLNYDALKEMNYLKACLCESMRLYPPVAWDSKHAATDDTLPDGTPVKRGDRVTYFPYGMGRMDELWGEDRLEFKPDRWFDEPGMLKMVSPYKFPVFQAGPRVCLGKEMAFIQMKYVMASILKRFDIKPVRSDRPVFLPLLTAHMAGGLKVMVRKRTGSCN